MKDNDINCNDNKNTSNNRETIDSNKNLNNSNDNKNKELFKFLLLGQEDAEELFLIKALEDQETNQRAEEIDETNKVKIEFSSVKKQDIDNSLIIIDGIIICIDNNIDNEKLNRTIDYIKKLDMIISKLLPKKFFPKIILGNKFNYTNILGKGNAKEGENISKSMNIFFVEPSTKRHIGIAFGVEILIKIINIYNNYQNFINDNKINEKQIMNTMCKTEINLLKCLKCGGLFEITIDKYSNSFYLSCNKCNYENKYNFLEYEKINKEFFIKCNDCKKQINKRSMMNYCYICKNNICSDCLKRHLQGEIKDLGNDNRKNIMCPYNLIDYFCNNHEKICYNYCLDCQKNICPICEIDPHLNHNKKIYDEKNIRALINIQKQNLELEKEEYIKMKEIVEDCFLSLREYFNDLILCKEKELNIKENIIKELEIFKYDNTLIENIKNLQFENYGIFYDYEDSWDKKLNNLFEYFKEPIKIKKYQICKKENLFGPYNFINQINLENNFYRKEQNDEVLTDICSLNNYLKNNYFAISFNNGLLKIYNDDFDHKIPIKIIKEFESYEGINSINKVSENTLLLIGNSIIKKINLSENFQEYKVINEIEINDQLFKTALELDSFNAIITTNNYNQLIIYDFKNSNKLFDIDNEEEILFIDKISENKIILQINPTNSVDLLNIDLDRETIRDSLYMRNNDDDFIFDMPRNYNSICSISNQNETNDVNWKIIEFEMEENILKIKKNHLFEKGENYLGKINNKILLLFNKYKNQLILFDYISYSYNPKFYFNLSLKPIESFPLKHRVDYLDLLLLCEGGYLIQLILDFKKGFIYLVTKIKIYEKNLKVNNISLLDLNSTNSSQKQNAKKENDNENNIIKVITLTKTNFLIVTKDNLIYNLKSS